MDPNIDTANLRYHPDMKPCNIDIARLHGQARRIYKFRPKDGSGPQIPLCPCCGLPAGGEEIGIFDGLEELYHLGSGYALYFRFIKYCIVLLLIQLLISGIYTLRGTSNGDCYFLEEGLPIGACNSQISMTVANQVFTGSQPYTGLDIPVLLDLVVVCVMVLFYQYMRYRNRKTIHDAEEKNITPADYTVIVEGVPEETTDDQIAQWVTGLGPFRVRRILRTWDINEYTRLCKLKNAEEVKLEKAKDPSHAEPIQLEINRLHDQLHTLKHGGLKFTKTAFVTFETAQEADIFRKLFVKSHLAKLFSCCFTKSEYQINGANVDVNKAPEPSDIMWEDLNVGEWEKHCRKIKTHFYTTILVLGSFGIVLFFNYYEHKLELEQAEGQPAPAGGMLPMIASVIIVVVNLILASIIRALARYEKVNTYTEFFTAIASKLCVAQFLNTAITTLVAQIWIYGTIQAMPIFTSVGLVHSIFDVFVSNAFMTPILILLDFGYYGKQSKQKKLEADAAHRENMRQVEAHDLFEGSAMDMASKYAVVSKTVLLTSFYAPAMPMASIISLIGLFLTYWFNKWVLLKRNILPNELGAQLQLEITHYIEWSAFLYALGSWFFYDNMTDGKFNVLLVAALIISLSNIFLPMEAVNEFLFTVGEPHLETQTFEEAKLEFLTDYDIENPITRKKALKDLMNHVNPGSAQHSPDDDPFEHVHDHAGKEADPHDITLGKQRRVNVDISHIIGEKQNRTKSKRRQKIEAGSIEFNQPKYDNPNLGQPLMVERNVMGGNMMMGGNVQVLDANPVNVVVYENTYEQPQPHHHKHHHHHHNSEF